jgi:hypothetical protein
MQGAGGVLNTNRVLRCPYGLRHSAQSWEQQTEAAQLRAHISANERILRFTERELERSRRTLVATKWGRLFVKITHLSKCQDIEASVKVFLSGFRFRERTLWRRFVNLVRYVSDNRRDIAERIYKALEFLSLLFELILHFLRTPEVWIPAAAAAYVVSTRAQEEEGPPALEDQIGNFEAPGPAPGQGLLQ